MKDEGTELQKRSGRIIEITRELKRLLPDVLAITGIENESSLHAKFGGKNDIFLDIVREVITSSDHFITLLLQGFMSHLEKLGRQETLYLLRELPPHEDPGRARVAKVSSAGR